MDGFPLFVCQGTRGAIITAMEISTSSNIMDLLRESTSGLHSDAEGQEFQRQLGTGTVHKEPYKKYLGQLFYMHDKLASLLKANEKENHIKTVLQSHHLDNSCLEKDLAYFDESVSSQPILKSTEKINAELEKSAKDAPYSLLGYLYVLEGSTNGAKFMAKTLQKSLSLPEDKGASYFDRYGDEQRPRWAKFKEDMNSVGFDEVQKAELVKAAKKMFQAFFEIGGELTR